MIQKKILFATDFSAGEKVAFEIACKFAGSWKAKLLIVHVDSSKDDTESVSPRLDLNHKLYRMHPENLEVDYEHILRHGDPATEILDIEHNRNVVLVILSTHGRKGIERIFKGSVAESILREADCPVMTLRRTDSTLRGNSELTRILLPVDFSVFGYAALDFATPLAKSLNAELTILHVNESTSGSNVQIPNGSQEWHEHESGLWGQLKKFVPKDGSVKFNHKLMVGLPAEQIPHYANSKHYDIVVLGTHGRSGVGRAVMGSVAEQIVRKTNCPIITVKPGNKRTPILR